MLPSWPTPTAPENRAAPTLIIAATARARNREVVSADLAGFAELPGVVLRSE